MKQRRRGASPPHSLAKRRLHCRLAHSSQGAAGGAMPVHSGNCAIGEGRGEW